MKMIPFLSQMIHSLLFIFLLSFISKAQTTIFNINCNGNFTVTLEARGTTKNITVSWVEDKQYSLNAVDDAIAGTLTFPPTTVPQKSAVMNFAKKIYENNNGVLIEINRITNVRYTSPNLNISVANSYSETGVTDISNSAFQNNFFAALNARKGTFAAGCVLANFFQSIEGQINTVLTNTTRTDILNKDIIQGNQLAKIGGTSKSSPYYDNDIRNPIAFTKFVVRNPRINGKGILILPSNMSSYNYIRPGSNILIEFARNVYTRLNGAKLSVKAYLKRKDESIIPVNADAYYKVNLKSNSNDFEKNNTTNNTLNYNYEITPAELPPLPVEISTANLNAGVGDKLVIMISNVSDGNVSFTTTFEFEEYGWTHQANGGFSWINNFNTGNKDFVPAGSAGYSFYYKLDKGSKFWRKFFMPSFGPELNVLQDANQNTVIGLGVSLSLFLRTFKVGYGWNIVGNNGRPYISLGVNFIEGFQSISSILKNVQSTSAQ